jgi:hypothetical protein
MVTATRIAPNAPSQGDSAPGAGTEAGGVSAITIGGGFAITDEEGKSEALAQLGGDSAAFGRSTKRKFEQENAR